MFQALGFQQQPQCFVPEAFSLSHCHDGPLRGGSPSFLGILAKYCMVLQSMKYVSAQLCLIIKPLMTFLDGIDSSREPPTCFEMQGSTDHYPGSCWLLLEMNWRGQGGGGSVKFLEYNSPQYVSCPRPHPPPSVWALTVLLVGRPR